MEKAKLLRKERNKRYYEKKQITSLDNKATSKTLKDSTDKTRQDKTRIDKKKNNNNIPYEEIIDDLNCIVDSNYKYNTHSTKEKIQARFNEGFVTEDFKKVNKIKAEQWLEDKNMRGYLRPLTLYGTKFESYLQEYKSKYKEEKENYGMCEAEKKFFEKQRGDNAAG